MKPLWHWYELCEALGVTPVDGPDVTGISIDSRRTRPGDLFIALTGDPGARFNPSHRSDRDGHDYIDAALAAGAVGVVAHDGRPRPAPQLQVRDTLDALWALGAAARRRLTCPVVAVTGSSGKTTAKALLAAALRAFASEGSLNNHLGVPWSLALTPRDVTAAVYEIGTNHPGEIAPLARLARPDVAVVLNVYPAHREYFDDMAALTREKLSIQDGLGAGGRLVLEENLPDEQVAATVTVSRFGRRSGCRVRLVGLEGREARFEIGSGTLTAHVPGGGEHRAMTLAAVLCVLDVLGRDPRDAATLGDELIVPGRGRELEAAGVILIDDSYNANPESMRAALVELARHPGRRRFALLGEMLELGDEGPAFHRRLAEPASAVDGVFCVGEGTRPLFEALPAGRGIRWAPQADDALAAAIVSVLERGDVLLIKGSNRVFWARSYVATLIQRLSQKEVKNKP